MSKTKEEILDPIEEPQEPELSPEESLEQQINEQSDAEQLRCYDLSLPGMPIKYITVQSKTLGKQVVSVPKYYELEDNGKTVGYQRSGEQKHIQDYDVKQTIEHAQVVGKRERGR